MEITFSNRLKKAWNAFTNRDPTIDSQDIGIGSSVYPDRPRRTRTNERSIVTSILNKISLDVAAINFKHCRLDDNGRYKEDVDSELNNCLTLETNMDQTSRAYIQDLVYSMLTEGVIAAVPTDVDVDPINTNSYDILAMRVGQILEWKPAFVKVRVYNERKGEKEDILLPKKNVAIIPNPLYEVMNEPNATAQRLTRKLSLLDITDERTASGKLDLIIQLPYTVKTKTQADRAETRRKSIEDQLTNSAYGIAYIDGTEKVVQLNRSLENNLMKQVEMLTSQLFAQLGLTQAILDGTASEQEMLNYYNRTVEPIVSAIVDEFKRKFLTRTARTQGQSIMAFRDPFKLVPMNNIAEMADKFTRNCIMTANEFRQVMGMKPADDPNADKLVNSNISQPSDGQTGTDQNIQNGDTSEAVTIMNDMLDQLQSDINNILSGGNNDET